MAAGFDYAAEHDFTSYEEEDDERDVPHGYMITTTTTTVTTRFVKLPETSEKWDDIYYDAEHADWRNGERIQVEVVPCPHDATYGETRQLTASGLVQLHIDHCEHCGEELDPTVSFETYYKHHGPFANHGDPLYLDTFGWTDEKHLAHI